MNLTVKNISNDQAKRNSVFMSTDLAKDASKTVNVRINKKVFKCSFAADIDRKNIGMSKNIRTFIGTDIDLSVIVEPIGQDYEIDHDLSFMEL